jgi:excinuclease ABC subunit A
LASVATLSGLWHGIRQLLAQSAEAKRRGFGPERFGFHAGGGRCSQCKGAGVRIEHLSLMPTVYLPCEVCEGKRFDAATLEVRWRGHSAADILLMPLKDARKVFGVHPRLRPLLDRLVELGLGYLPLGQRGDSLSGGERQRLRLCKELGSSSLPQSLYLLHEPSVGLHPADMARLLACLRGLSNGGATVLVLDHDPLLLSGCDQRIRLGN